MWEKPGGLVREIGNIGRNQGGLVRDIGDVGRNQRDWLERLGISEETRGTG